MVYPRQQNPERIASFLRWQVSTSQRRRSAAPPPGDSASLVAPLGCDHILGFVEEERMVIIASLSS